MNDAMPPELRRLIDSEGLAPVATEAARLAVRAKLGTTLGITKAAGVGFGGLKLITLLLGVIGVSVAVYVVTRSEGAGAERMARVEHDVVQPPPAPTRAARAPDRVAASADPIASAPRAKSIRRELPPPPRPPSSTARVAATEVPATGRMLAEPAAPSQASLLARATRAVYDGDAARGLALVDEDSRAHPDGPLAEERDALRLSCLLALDRRDEARTVARQFARRFPRTIHQQLIARALSATEVTP
jgi:hypothetical protein